MTIPSSWALERSVHDGWRFIKIDLGITGDSKLQYIRSEGLQALQNRLKDQSDETKRVRKLKQLEVEGGKLTLGFEPPSVLNVSSIPPTPNRGGSQVQMLDRLDEERKRRPIALAYPRDGSWWLEMSLDDEAGIYQLGTKANLNDLLIRAARLVGTNTIHIENLRGLPINLMHGLEKQGVTTILTIYDFTLFCRRAHLIDTLTEKFCNYSQDLPRCDACLHELDPEGRYPQRDYRKIGAASIHAASYVVFPSSFIQRRYHELFPSRKGGQRETVIAPASARPEAFVDRKNIKPNIAFVGGIHPHKGGRLIPAVMRRIQAEEKKAVGFVYGYANPELLGDVKNAKGIKVRGYYRRNSLGKLLAQDKIGVAILPSIWPESYAMVVDECLATGLPVVAFNSGAVGDRLGFWTVGELVSPTEGADGLARGALEVLAGGRIGTDVMRTLPSIERNAQKYTDLYRNVKHRGRAGNGIS